MSLKYGRTNVSARIQYESPPILIISHVSKLKWVEKDGNYFNIVLARAAITI